MASGHMSWLARSGRVGEEDVELCVHDVTRLYGLSVGGAQRARFSRDGNNWDLPSFTAIAELRLTPNTPQMVLVYCGIDLSTILNSCPVSSTAYVNLLRAQFGLRHDWVGLEHRVRVVVGRIHGFDVAQRVVEFWRRINASVDDLAILENILSHRHGPLICIGLAVPVIIVVR
jgi:hypothetical protein